MKVFNSWNVQVIDTTVYNNIHVQRHNIWTLDHGNGRNTLNRCIPLAFYKNSLHKNVSFSCGSETRVAQGIAVSAWRVIYWCKPMLTVSR